jgi:uncharacterized protein YjdB
MSLSKRNFIIIGAIILVLIVGIFLTFKSKKSTTVQTNQTTGIDFDTELEEPTPIPTKIPTLTPTLIPTLIPTPTLTPTLTPTKAPTSTPRPTKTPTATPTPDNSIYATGVVLNTTELTLTVNETYQISYRVEPNETTNKTVSWSSDNGNVATVTNDGLITGKNIGEVWVTASTVKNKTTRVKVRVVESKITPTILPTPTAVPYPNQIDLSLVRLILEKNETKQLYVKYQPENITNKSIVWSVSNGSIMTVSADGLLTAKSAGVATVEVETINGLTDAATVIVDPFGTGFSSSSTSNPTTTMTPTPTTTSTADSYTENSQDVAYENFFTPGGLDTDNSSVSNPTAAGYGDNYQTNETVPSSWLATYHPYQNNMIPAGTDMTKYQIELSKKLTLAGIRTREAVVAAALYLAEDFPWTVPYYPGGYSGSGTADSDGGFWGNGDGTYSTPWGTLVEVKGNGHTYSGLSCGEFNDWAYLTAGFQLRRGESFTEENTEWLSNTKDCAAIASILKPADLIYKREEISPGVMKVTHVALVVEIKGQVVKYAQSSGGYGVNIQYIDLCSLKPINGGKNSFNFYVSMDKYFAAYGN